MISCIIMITTDWLSKYGNQTGGDLMLFLFFFFFICNERDKKFPLNRPGKRKLFEGSWQAQC